MRGAPSEWLRASPPAELADVQQMSERPRLVCVSAGWSYSRWIFVLHLRRHAKTKDFTPFFTELNRPVCYFPAVNRGKTGLFYIHPHVVFASALTEILQLQRLID